MKILIQLRAGTSVWMQHPKKGQPKIWRLLLGKEWKEHWGALSFPDLVLWPWHILQDNVLSCSQQAYNTKRGKSSSWLHFKACCSCTEIKVNSVNTFLERKRHIFFQLISVIWRQIWKLGKCIFHLRGIIWFSFLSEYLSVSDSDSFFQDKAILMQSRVPNSYPQLLKQVNFARTVGVKPEHHSGLQYRDPRF